MMTNKNKSMGIAVCVILLSGFFPLIGAPTLEDTLSASSVRGDRETSSVFDPHMSQSSILIPQGTSQSVFLPVSSQGSHYRVSRISDDPPNPPWIEGPITGKIRTIYSYNVTVTDPYGESMILLEVDFGDGTEILEECSCNNGPWASGTTITVEHGWKQQGAFLVRARVQDTSFLWSDWGTLEVTMAKSSPIPLWGLWGRLQGILPSILR